MTKKWIYILLPLQLLILLLSPRFGWKMYSPEAAKLSYGGTTYEDGNFQVVYKDEDEKITVCYEGIFSKRFLVIVNDMNEYEIGVEIDGKLMEGSDQLRLVSNDIIWNDSCGIFGWRYLLSIAMTLGSILLIRRRNYMQVFPCILYGASILISFRVLF